MITTDQDIILKVERWLDQVVIGLNLCPFAAKPKRNKQIKIAVCNSTDEAVVLEQLESEIRQLQQHAKFETTLLVLAKGFDDFYVFNQFLNWVDQLISGNQWQGEYQIATFHPHYQFANTEENDKQNLTNKAPYPILHILREDSVEKAIEHYPDVENIPTRNIERMESLSEEEVALFFNYLT